MKTQVDNTLRNLWNRMSWCILAQSSREPRLPSNVGGFNFIKNRPCTDIFHFINVELI